MNELWGKKEIDNSKKQKNMESFKRKNSYRKRLISTDLFFNATTSFGQGLGVKIKGKWK